LDDLIMLVKAALADDCVLDDSEKDDIIVLIDDVVWDIVGDDNDEDDVDDDVELLEMLEPYQLPPPECSQLLKGLRATSIRQAVTAT
jgi:hypothetical protein